MKEKGKDNGMPERTGEMPLGDRRWLNADGMFVGKQLCKRRHHADGVRSSSCVSSARRGQKKRKEEVRAGRPP